jgi:hypothetical protein
MKLYSGVSKGRNGHFAVLGLIAAILLVVGPGLLVGCESPAAQRERAEAQRISAEAQAYQQRLQADTAAAAERAALREAAREAGHQRTLELLPYLVIVVGALLLAGLGVMIYWDPRSRIRPDASQETLLLHLERLQIRQAEQERVLWHAICEMQRRMIESESKGTDVMVIGDPRE